MRYYCISCRKYYNSGRRKNQIHCGRCMCKYRKYQLKEIPEFMPCLNCHKMNRTYGFKKNFCNRKCYDAYRLKNNKKYMYAQGKEWRKKNKEKICEKFKVWYSNPKNKKRMLNHIHKYNKKNKIKNNSRKTTRKLFYQGRLEIKKKCRYCEVTDVQFHHEVYPTKTKDIIKEVKKGKIYFLCREHHPKGRPSLFLTFLLF